MQTLQAVWRDLLYALRTMRKSPGFTAVAIITLALGIGANTALFSVVSALLLRNLPLPDPGRLLLLTGANPARPGGGFPFSLIAYEGFRDRVRALSGITAYCGEGLNLTGAGDPVQLPAALVSANFFDVLQAHPLLGRTFEASEGEPGGSPVVLISHSLWQQRFAADPAILGKPITLGNDAYSIIGVLPPNFQFPFAGIDVWATGLSRFNNLLPAQIRNGAGYLMAIARLNSGFTASQAEAELSLLDRQYRREFAGNPDADPNTHLTLLPLQEALVSDVRPTLLTLAGVTGFVLLIACANVASLILARATGRARELAVRAALGAGRARLVRQLLAESLLLAAGGAFLGTLLARWGVVLLMHQDVALPGFPPVRVDLQVLAFTLVISLLTGLLFGLMPALQVTRLDLNSVMRDSGWGTTGGARRHRTRSLLVAGQIALSIVLLIGAGLLLESFRRLRTVDAGFQPAHALTMKIALPPARYPDELRRTRFIGELVGRLQMLHGVRSASASLGLPLGTPAMAPFLPEGEPAVPVGRQPLGTWYAVTPRYFETLGIPLLRGRDFSTADDEKAPRTIIVSQSLARRFWPNEDPIGKHVTYARRQIRAEVVGVAGDVRTQGLETDAGLIFYTPYPQYAWPNMAVTIRAEGDPRRLLRDVRAQVLALDRDLPVINPRTLDDVVDEVLSQRRQTMVLVSGFAALALLLAAVGLYGVMAYSVAQRTTEIGIRQAIGAQPSDIFRMVLGQALRLSLAGIAAGTLAAWALTRLISKMLYHVGATDPFVFGGIALLFLVIALSAAWLPARRATRIDPIAALRQ